MALGNHRRHVLFHSHHGFDTLAWKCPRRWDCRDRSDSRFDDGRADAYSEGPAAVGAKAFGLQHTELTLSCEPIANRSIDIGVTKQTKMPNPVPDLLVCQREVERHLGSLVLAKCAFDRNDSVAG